MINFLDKPFIQHVTFIRGVKDLWLMGFAIISGMIGAVVVRILNLIIETMHHFLFHLSNGGHLSGLLWVNPWYSVTMPIMGGLLLWQTRRWINRYFSQNPVDIVEANALHGGRLNVADSLYVGLQTILTTGFGLSLGLEAAYTQISSACISRLSEIFALRKEDIRVLVGCGAGAAIAAEFNSPLGGAFYAFEIVIASYNIVNFTPVILAAIVGVVTAHWLGMRTPILNFPAQIPVVHDYVSIVFLALLCALIGIAIMYFSAQLEVVVKKNRLGQGFPLVAGGAVIGLLSLITPAILSSGHAVVWVSLAGGVGFKLACLILLLKAFASTISIGVGFRGGLFFASMLIGCAAGIVFGHGLAFYQIHALSPLVYGLMGMATMAVVIIGGPLSMTFLTLEMTKSYPYTGCVLLSVLIAQFFVRKLFGFSFATWRFHLRGENTQSALDISWLRRSKIESLMHYDLTIIDETTSIKEARKLFLSRNMSKAIVRTSNNQYVGMVYTHILLNPELDSDQCVKEIVCQREIFILPQMEIKDALNFFESKHIDFAVVVSREKQRYIIGGVYKNDVLKTYTQFLENQIIEVTGFDFGKKRA
ncbi:Voltage-gated ClC-type chloride channel ClcB [Commensalibacter sp. Nvir]|uniref:chloride channel protein n=1 Tax=Commensalibacter sp. Nvir TaxID=3069817 RepID=UPI002D6B8E71|nr:Voltage-gated ClC-type chloride channel ClcB [Commensalibacter sp. Nvir]